MSIGSGTAGLSNQSQSLQGDRAHLHLALDGTGVWTLLTTAVQMSAETENGGVTLMVNNPDSTLNPDEIR